ncbi:hypothetical protein [Mycolicibacterium sp.]|uniref:hypothetical protein n=1 Tax=Mycolicibacterium sp. TaxID=2320850 RepID=UPI0037C62C61
MSPVQIGPRCFAIRIPGDTSPTLSSARWSNFVRRWHLYGGGPAAQIFVEFGISESEFFTRTLQLLGSDYIASRIDAGTMGRLRDVCELRLNDAADHIMAPPS